MNRRTEKFFGVLRIVAIIFFLISCGDDDMDTVKCVSYTKVAYTISYENREGDRKTEYSFMKLPSNYTESQVNTSTSSFEKQVKEEYKARGYTKVDVSFLPSEVIEDCKGN